MRRVIKLCLVVVAFIVLSASCNSQVATEETDNKKTLPPVEKSSIGTMIGSVNDSFAKSEYPKATIQSFNNYSESVLALMEDEIDYAMMDYATATNFVKKHPNELAVLPEKLTDEVTAIALNKNNAEINAQINEIVNRYLEEGTIDEIISYWIKVDPKDYKAAESKAPKEGRPLRIAITTEMEPRCFMLDGKPAGMVIELMDKICTELNMVPVYEDMDFGKMLKAMENDEIDVIPALYKTPEREKIADFTKGYFPNPQVFIVKKDRMDN